MDATDRGRLPSDLARAHARFEAWRRQRQVGARIPQPLWALAARLVSRYGVSRTSSALGLDYYGLKKRAEESANPRPSGGPAFIELRSPVMAAKQCRFELANGAGATMQVELTSYDTADVEAIARTFWNVERCCKSPHR
jgi:hypothetical protein